MGYGGGEGVWCRFIVSWRYHIVVFGMIKNRGAAVVLFVAGGGGRIS